MFLPSDLCCKQMLHWETRLCAIFCVKDINSLFRTLVIKNHIYSYAGTLYMGLSNVTDN